MVKYVYDAWDKILSTTAPLASTLGAIQPFRYRSYVYDQETGLYYLRSRYYKPAWNRFINKDIVLLSKYEQDLFCNNLYVYCSNNPIHRTDASGAAWFLAALFGGIVNTVTTYIAAKATGQEYTWVDAGVNFIAGATNAIPYVGPYLSGTIVGSYTTYMALENGASIEDALLCGVVTCFATTLSISNLANFNGTTLNAIKNAGVDFVFGTGYNTVASATYKGVMSNTEINNSQNALNQKDIHQDDNHIANIVSIATSMLK